MAKELPYLPDIPEAFSVTAEFVRSLKLLRLDDDVLTLDEYVGVVDNHAAAALLALERRIVAIERRLESGD